MHQEQDAILYYNGVTSAVPATELPEWTQSIEAAEHQRDNNPEAMDIYQPKVQKAATMREIEVQLSKREINRGESGGGASWLSQGIQAEHAQ